MSIALTNLYLIRNCGCNDTTTGLVRMTDEELEFFKTVIENLNRNSTYGCMPTIDVYRIDEDFIREFTDEDCKDDALYLDDKVYVLKDKVAIWKDVFEARMVIC